MTSHIPDDSPFDILNSEFEKLQKTIESLSKNSEKTIPDIVNLYYQATMVETLSKKIKSDIIDESKSENQSLLTEIDRIQTNINENFSQSIHLEILGFLTNSIKTSTENLKSLNQNSGQKTKQTIDRYTDKYDDEILNVSGNVYLITEDNMLIIPVEQTGDSPLKWKYVIVEEVFSGFRILEGDEVFIYGYIESVL